jgi:hypothetical protein
MLTLPRTLTFTPAQFAEGNVPLRGVKPLARMP